MAKVPSKRAKQTTVLFAELPEDMQELLSSFAEDRHVEIDEKKLARCKIALIVLSVEDLHQQVLASRARVKALGGKWWDYRGEAHVKQMRQSFENNEEFPPIVVENGRWIDGRHRIMAAKAAGKNEISAIDFSIFANQIKEAKTSLKMSSIKSRASP